MDEPKQCLSDESNSEHLDKRVHDELETLNIAADEINTLEKKLDVLKSTFGSTLHNSTQILKQIQRRAFKHIEKARPYYDALQFAMKAQVETQKAAQKFQRAAGIHKAAKETIALAEERLFSISGDKREFDSAWQEMLNHATIKVNESEVEKLSSEQEHESRSREYARAQAEVADLERRLRSSISKSRPYFQHKLTYEQTLHEQKLAIDRLTHTISTAKKRYANALGNLELISNEVHENRRMSAATLDVLERRLCEVEDVTTSRTASITLDSLQQINLDTLVLADDGDVGSVRSLPSPSPSHSTTYSSYYFSEDGTEGHEALSRKASDLSTTTRDGVDMGITITDSAERKEDVAGSAASSSIKLIEQGGGAGDERGKRSRANSRLGVLLDPTEITIAQ